MSLFSGLGDTVLHFIYQRVRGALAPDYCHVPHPCRPRLCDPHSFRFYLGLQQDLAGLD